MDLLSQQNYNRPTQCTECGGNMKFMGVGEYRCEQCRAIAYDDYGIVRLYIEKHRGATAAEISDETGISQRSIRQMLKEDRLEITKDSNVFMRCEKCGVNIRGGKYCTKCSSEVSAIAPTKKPTNNLAGHSTELPKAGQKGAKRYL